MDIKLKKVSSKKLELEVQIKLLNYLKEGKFIDDSMYNFCINKLLNKIVTEKSKINDEYKKNFSNYNLVT